MKKITLLGVLLTTMAASVMHLNAQSLSGLVSLWHGESNVVDSVSGQNGTLQAQQVSYTAGEVGQAFNISGGIVTVPDSSSLEPTNITVQAWVKASSPGAFRYIVCKARGAGGASYAFYTGSTGGAIFFVNLLNGTAGDTFAPSPSAPTTIWDNNWHQLTGTFDGVTSHLYVDGAEVGSGLVTTNTNPIDYSSPQPLIFGDYQVARGLPYLGALDEVKIFGRALSATDAQTTYTNLSSPAGLTGLISWYQAEGNALDSKGTNNGTVSTPKVFSFGPGKVGQAFFPQGGIAVIPDSPVLEPTNLTLQVWVKSVAPSTFRYMIAKSRGAGGISYALYTGGGAGLIFFVNLANGGGTVLSPLVPTGLVWDGAWHLATGVWDGTTSHIYLDGVEFGTGTTSASGANGIDYSSPNPLIFGDYQTAGGLPFVGLMDEVQLYNRALSPAEILTSYAGSNLVSWWNANTNSNDSVGGNNGTLLGGVSYGPSKSFYGTAFNTIGGAVKIPDSASLRPTNITVEAQINGTAPGTNKYIISKSYNSASSSYAIYTGASSGLQFYVTLNGLGKVTSPDAGKSIWDGTYHLVDGTYDGQKVHLYVDGIEVGTGTTGVGQIQYGTSQSSGELLFGDFTDALSASNFTGSIDEIKIYNSALSAAQVGQNSFQEVLIINQPQNQNLVQGGNINLSVSAQGPPPLGYQWSFNGTNIPGATNSALVISNAQPAQAGQYNVLITGGLAKYIAGVSGQALQVGSGALVEIPDNAAYETQNFTVQLYARAKAPGLYQYLFSKSRDPAFYSSSYGFYTGGSGGMIWFVVLSPPTPGSQAYGFVPVDAGTNVWDGAWHQLTGTWDGEFVNLYVDGVLNKSVDSFGGTVDYQQYFLNGDVLIGDVLSPPSQYHFSGDEDEVKYFDHALVASDVMDSYTNKTGFGATNGLVSWYKLDGNPLDSARHNDGRIVPAPGSVLSAPAFVLGASATFSAVGITAGNFQATLTGPSGQTFVIQRSSDLIHWTPIQTNTVPLTFSDPVVSGSGGRFYRAQGQ